MTTAGTKPSCCTLPASKHAAWQIKTGGVHWLCIHMGILLNKMLMDIDTTTSFAMISTNPIEAARAQIVLLNQTCAMERPLDPICLAFRLNMSALPLHLSFGPGAHRPQSHLRSIMASAEQPEQRA